jgi:hypothetical protein
MPRFFNIFVGLSALTCFSLIALLARSYYACDSWHWWRYRPAADRAPVLDIKIFAANGQIEVVHSAGILRKAPSVVPTLSHLAMPRGQLMFDSGFRFAKGDESFIGGLPAYGTTQTLIDFPIWTLTVATAVLPLVWITFAVRRQRRVIGCKCGSCGYDLRATPGRCPECGTIPGQKK